MHPLISIYKVLILGQASRCPWTITTKQTNKNKVTDYLENEWMNNHCELEWHPGWWCDSQAGEHMPYIWTWFYYLLSTLVSFLWLWENSLIKSNRRDERVHSAYNSRFQHIIVGKSEQELQQLVTWLPQSRAETIKCHVLLACIYLSSVLHRLPCLENGTTHNGLGLPTPISNQDNPS